MDGPQVVTPVPIRPPGGRRGPVVAIVALAAVVVLAVAGVFGLKLSAPPPPPAPSISPSPAASGDPDIAWEEIPLDPQVFGDTPVLSVFAGDGRLVAFGRTPGNGSPVVWTSNDGRAWSRHPQPQLVFGGGLPDSALVTKDVVVALGWHATSASVTREIWTSTDGATWTRDPRPSAGGITSSMTFAARDGLLVGTATVEAGTQLTMLSRDGLLWLREAEAGPTGLGPGRLSVARDRDGFVAAATTGQDTSLLGSTDGLTWRPKGTIANAFATGLAVTDVGTIVAGISTASGGYGPLQLWATSGGGVFHEIEGSSSAAIGNERSALLTLDGAVFAGTVADEEFGGGEIGGTSLTRDLDHWRSVTKPDAIDAVTDWRHQATVVDGHLLVFVLDPRDGLTHLFEGRVERGNPAIHPPDVLVTAASTAGASAASSAAKPTFHPSEPEAPDSQDVQLGSDLVWQRVETAGVFGQDATLARVIPFLASRLVVVGTVGRDAASWVSTDLGWWTRAPAQRSLEDAAITDVIATERGLVAVGSTPGPYRPQPPSGAIWTSPDGLTWTKVATTGPGRLLTVAERAVDLRTELVVGGFTSPAAAPGEQFDDLLTPAAWVSVDGGASWTPASGIATDSGSGAISSISAGEGGFWVAFGDDGGTSAEWTSTDGVRWNKAGAVAENGTGRRADENQTSLTYVSGIGFVGSAPSMTQGRGIGARRVFFSVDGSSWEPTPFEHAVLEDVLHVRAVGRGLAAVGSRGGSYQAPTPAAWLSDDGRHWRAVDPRDLVDGDVSSGNIIDVAELKGVIVAIGEAYGKASVSPQGMWLGVPMGTRVSPRLCVPPSSIRELTYLDTAVSRACWGTTPLEIRAWAHVSTDPGCSECDRQLDLLDDPRGNAQFGVTWPLSGPAVVDGRYLVRLHFDTSGDCGRSTNSAPGFAPPPFERYPCMSLAVDALQPSK